MSYENDVVHVLAVSQEDYERLMARAADLGMPVALYTAMCLDFCEQLPFQMLAAWRTGVLNFDVAEE